MKENTEISQPVESGMNREVHPSLVKATQTSFCLNANTETFVGGVPFFTNEGSNILTTMFPTGYKVIGYKTDLLTNRTYVFLTNPATGYSSFGYVSSNLSIVQESDEEVECDDCSKHNQLGIPLEDTEQEPINSYTELLNDICEIEGGIDKAFNFSIDFPIKSIEIKNEKIGTTIYFTDNRNPQRYIQVDNLSIYTTDTEPCSDNTMPTCLNVDLMRIFPTYTIPEIEVDSIVSGGNLKVGTYQFAIAYSDNEFNEEKSVHGNELSSYYSLTNPVAIFDFLNRNLIQPDLDARTNKAIKLTIKNLDKKFKYYKIVCIQHADLQNVESYYTVGTYDINVDTVIYASELNKQRIASISIINQKPHYEKAKGLMSSDGRLFQYGLTTKVPYNLQPVVNVMSQFLQWQTSISNETLYKDGVAHANYKGYNRDEVYPFSIRFLNKNGTKSPIYPFVGRGYEDFENELAVYYDEDGVAHAIDGNKDVDSILSMNTGCNSTIREKVWQYYNTATEDTQGCSNDEIKTVIVTEDIEKKCTIEGVSVAPTNTFSIEIDEDFIDLKSFIEDNKDNCILYDCETPGANTYPFCNYMQLSCYEDINCTPTFTTETVSTLEVDMEYIIYQLNIGDDFTNVGFSEVGVVFVATSTTPTVWTNTVVYKNNCGAPTKSADDKIVVGLIEDEVVTKIASVLEDGEYAKIKPTQQCVIYETDTTGALVQDTDFMADYMDAGKKAYVRRYGISNTSCSYADDLQNVSNANSLPQSYYHNYLGSTTLSDLFSTQDSTSIDFVSSIYVSGIGTGFIKVLGVDYGITVTITGSTAAAINFISNHGAAIELATGGVLTQTSGLLKLTNPDVGYFESFTQVSGSSTEQIYASGFNKKISNNALWFKGNTNKRSSFLLEVTKQLAAVGKDDIPLGDNLVRISVYNSCSATATLLFADTVNLSIGAIYEVSIENKEITFKNELGDVTTAIPYTGSKFYVAIDNKITSIDKKYRTAPTNGCFGVATRDIEYTRADISYTSIRFDKVQTYTATCNFEIPESNGCDAIPYKKGEFAYWESIETYPDNKQLYDSSVLIIKPTDIPIGKREKFEDKFVLGGSADPQFDSFGNYIFKSVDSKSILDLRCEPIRHFKMPDNKVAPFMWTAPTAPFSQSLIFPLGVTIDETLINSFLDIAYNNGLLTLEERNEIVGYEILRGDRLGNRSVEASGYLYDMRSYMEKSRKIHYSNYPYNDLGDDVLNNQTHSSTSNYNFTFHSPETDFSYVYSRIQPSELKVEGYIFGNSKGYFADVKKHPKWVILGGQAKTVATVFAALEVALEVASVLAESAEVFRVDGGFTFSFNAPGIVLASTKAVAAVAASYVKAGRYRYEWLTIFKNLGVPKNFAYYYTSEGYYNYMNTLQENGESLRAINIVRLLDEGNYTVENEVTKEKFNINNKSRERSTFLSLGADYGITWNSVYKNYDNNNVDDSSSSLSYASASDSCATELSNEVIKNIASPYVKLKQYLPSQYGNINNISWINTGYIGDLQNPSTECISIFGGDTFITRYDLKRKIALFRDTAMGLPNDLGFNYRELNNIGTNPKFYCSYDFKDNSDNFSLSDVYPDINSDYSFDCYTGGSKMYVKPPSKFYLYYYGIPKLLCETEINTNYRYGGITKEEDFSPNVGDFVDWTQESNVSIYERNTFHYNDVFSRPTTLKLANDSFVQREDYNKSEEILKNNLTNFVIYSKQDFNDNTVYDPWLVYRLFDSYEFPKKYGKLIHLADVGSSIVLGRFENQQVVFNSTDKIVTQSNKEILLATGGDTNIFATRPQELKVTDLGYGGTQNMESLNTPFGILTVDAKRGQIFLGYGKSSTCISDGAGNKISGLRQWFKEHLPFKLLKQIPQADTDNKFKGLGLSMGWDEKYQRIFLTKKDYILQNGINKNDFEVYQGILYYQEEAVEFSNTAIFKDVSWTIAYKPLEASWVSYYSFKPNYYIDSNNYFQTGLNTNGTLWGHNLIRNSYQVFYGNREPFIVELPIKNDNVNKLLSNISIDLEAKRFTSDWDFSQHKNVGFNKVIIYNTTNNSGLINLELQKSLRDLVKYPITNLQKTEQSITFTSVDDKHNFNYFYNRVVNQDNNIPQWLWDSNMINKDVNVKAVNFKPNSKVLDRLRGENFSVRLIQDKESRFQITLKDVVTTNLIY